MAVACAQGVHGHGTDLDGIQYMQEDLIRLSLFRLRLFKKTQLGSEATRTNPAFLGTADKTLASRSLSEHSVDLLLFLD